MFLSIQKCARRVPPSLHAPNFAAHLLKTRRELFLTRSKLRYRRGTKRDDAVDLFATRRFEESRGLRIATVLMRLTDSRRDYRSASIKRRLSIELDRAFARNAIARQPRTELLSMAVYIRGGQCTLFHRGLQFSAKPCPRAEQMYLRFVVDRARRGTRKLTTLLYIKIADRAPIPLTPVRYSRRRRNLKDY